MKFEYEIFDSDLEDRKKIIAMKEEVRQRIDNLSQFGQNTMLRSLNRLKSDLEYCETEWFECQQVKLSNTLSQVMNLDREGLKEKYWREDD